jgi:hypothetical protein
MQHPDFILMIHRSQQVQSKHQTSVLSFLAPSFASDLRTAIGRTLIALGTRMAPETRQTPRKVGALASSGRADI